MKSNAIHAFLFATLFAALIGCPEKKPTPPPPTTITPIDFVGVWVLIPATAPSDPSQKQETRTLLLHQSKTERPAAPTGTFMDGDVDKRMLIKGTATDNTFIGTWAIPKFTSWSGTIMLTIHQRGSATVFIDNTPYRGIKRTQ